MEVILITTGDIMMIMMIPVPSRAPVPSQTFITTELPINVCLLRVTPTRVLQTVRAVTMVMILVTSGAPVPGQIITVAPPINVCPLLASPVLVLLTARALTMAILSLATAPSSTIFGTVPPTNVCLLYVTPIHVLPTVRAMQMVMILVTSGAPVPGQIITANFSVQQFPSLVPSPLQSPSSRGGKLARIAARHGSQALLSVRRTAWYSPIDIRHQPNFRLVLGT